MWLIYYKDVLIRINFTFNVSVNFNGINVVNKIFWDKYRSESESFCSRFSFGIVCRRRKIRDDPYPSTKRITSNFLSLSLWISQGLYIADPQTVVTVTRPLLYVGGGWWEVFKLPIPELVPLSQLFYCLYNTMC